MSDDRRKRIGYDYPAAADMRGDHIERRIITRRIKHISYMYLFTVDEIGIETSAGYLYSMYNTVSGLDGAVPCFRTNARHKEDRRGKL